MLDEYICYYHKYSNIEEHDGKYRPQESTKENTSFTNEAAGEKKVKNAKIANHAIAIAKYLVAYYLIVCMSVALLESLALLIVGGENVTMKLRSIANGMSTGTIGITAAKESQKTQWLASGYRHAIYIRSGNLHQQTRETAMMYLVVTWKNTMTSFWNINTASAPIHIQITSVK